MSWPDPAGFRLPYAVAANAPGEQLHPLQRGAGDPGGAMRSRVAHAGFSVPLMRGNPA